MKKACKISKAKGSNIVQAKHLQEAVAGEKIFDFLQVKITPWSCVLKKCKRM